MVRVVNLHPKFPKLFQQNHPDAYDLTSPSFIPGRAARILLHKNKTHLCLSYEHNLLTVPVSVVV